MFSTETYREKETAVILKRIDQLPQNLARVRNLVRFFDGSHKNFYFFYCFYCFLLFIYCPSFVATLILQQRNKMSTDGKI